MQQRVSRSPRWAANPLHQSSNTKLNPTPLQLRVPATLKEVTSGEAAASFALTASGSYLLSIRGGGFHVSGSHPRPQTLIFLTGESRLSIPCTLHPKPEIRDARPETRDPRPETRNPKPATRNPKPETRNPKPTTHHPPTSTHYPPPTTHHPPPSTLDLTPLPTPLHQVTIRAAVCPVWGAARCELLLRRRRRDSWYGAARKRNQAIRFTGVCPAAKAIIWP